MFYGQGEKEQNVVTLLSCNASRKLSCILLCTSQNKLVYVRPWSGIVREELHMVSRPETIGHPPGIYALEFLVTHCVPKSIMHTK